MVHYSWPTNIHVLRFNDRSRSAMIFNITYIAKKCINNDEFRVCSELISTIMPGVEILCKKSTTLSGVLLSAADPRGKQF